MILWNMQGINIPAKQRCIKEKLDIICIQETKISKDEIGKIVQNV